MSRRVDVCMTVIGGKDTARTITESAALLGYESGRSTPEHPVEFVDFPFTREEEDTLQRHVSAVREARPKYAVAPDIEAGRTLVEVEGIGDRLLQYAEHVVVVPKAMHPSEVPERFRVGLPAADFGSGAPWGAWDYRGVGPVHLLGGSPRRQQTIGEHVEVGSLDTSALQRGCSFGEWWVGKWVQAPDSTDFYERLRVSLDHYARSWGADVQPDAPLPA